jgi:hypothetical protein
MRQKRPEPRPEEDIAKILKFAPVSRKCNRSDGWTPERQRAFIAALADTGCVTRAAMRANMSTESAYMLRRQPKAAAFCKAWAEAIDHGVRRIEDVAFERAIEGVVIPIFYKGEQVGERRWYNERLLMFILRHHDPDRYGSGSPAGRLSPATVKKLRAEWEQDQARKRIQERKDSERDVLEELNQIYERIMADDERTRDRRLQEEHDRRLAERAALGLPGPIDPLNMRPPIPPQVPSPWAKPGYEWPRGWGPAGKRPALPPPGPKIREL